MTENWWGKDRGGYSRLFVPFLTISLASKLGVLTPCGFTWFVSGLVRETIHKFKIFVLLIYCSNVLCFRYPDIYSHRSNKNRHLSLSIYLVDHLASWSTTLSDSASVEWQKPRKCSWNYAETFIEYGFTKVMGNNKKKPHAKAWGRRKSSSFSVGVVCPKSLETS